MKAAVLIILYGGLFYGFWLIYALINYKYGKRIREYRQRKNDLREAYKIIQKAREETALRVLEESRPIEVEVEEVPQTSFSWNVANTKRLGETLVTTELIILNND